MVDPELQMASDGRCDLFENRPARGGNELLELMSLAAFNSINEYLKTVFLPAGTCLEGPEIYTNLSYFLSDGIASQVLDLPGHDLHPSIIGREGLVAPVIFFGERHSGVDTVMQIAGLSMCISTSILTDAVETCLPLREVLLRYTQVRAVEAAQAATLELRFTIDQRTARWILMCHDRVDGDLFPLTYAAIALLVGAGREEVDRSIRLFEHLGCIQTTRGWIEVMDRMDLTRVAGRSYGAAETAYDRLLR